MSSATKSEKKIIITKIDDQIYLGPFKHPNLDTNRFKQLSIDVIINCAKEIEFPIEVKNKYNIIKFPLEDDEYASLIEYIDDINITINDNLSKGKKIYLCCSDGNSRSPAVLIYYLMTHRMYMYDDAFNFIKLNRPTIDINQNFENELRTIEEY